MQRLLKDAEKLTGVKYDISNLKDVYLAIHAIQDEMGITGTTQKEAATTIEGSLNATKAAWENILTALSGGGSLKKAINQFLKAVFGDGEGTGLLNQIKPRIIQVFKGIGQFLEYLAPFIIENIPRLIEEIAPSLMKAAVDLLKTLPKVLATLIPGLVTSVKTLFSIVFGKSDPDKNTFISLATNLTTSLNDMLSTEINWKEIGYTLSTALDNVLTSIYTFINNVDWEQIGKNIGEFLANIDWIQLLSDLVLVIWGAIKAGWNILTGLLKGLGIIDFWSDLVWKIVQKVQNAWKTLKEGFGKAIKFVKDLFKGIGDWIYEKIILPVINIFKTLKNTIKTILTSIKETFKTIFDGIWSIIKGIINTIIGGLNKLWGGIYKVVAGIVNTLSSVAETAGDLLGQDWSFSIPEKPPLIPKLAQGAVIPKNFGEFPAILGDNKQETEVVSPLSTIKKAVKEANRESGSILDEYTLSRLARLVAKYLSFDIYLDTGALVGGTAPQMSRQLAKIQKIKKRGGTV